MSELSGLRDKSVVVTGASGYIGTELVNELLKLSCNVIRVSRKKLTDLQNTELIQGDIQSEKIWRDIVRRADIIYHLAGNTSVYTAAKNPIQSLKSTLLPVNHLVNVLRGSESKPRVIFSSSATVYGLTPKLPTSENFEPVPITIYDLHKLFAEQKLSFAARQGLLESISFRVSNVYGPSGGMSAQDRGILNKVTACALKGKNLNVYGDGDYLRDYIYINDVIRALLIAGAKKGIQSGIYNLSTGNSVTIRSAFQMIASKISISPEKPININQVPWPNGVSEIEFRNYISDIGSISSKLGWRPEVTLESGIESMIKKLRIE